VEEDRSAAERREEERLEPAERDVREGHAARAEPVRGAEGRDRGGEAGRPGRLAEDGPPRPDRLEKEREREDGAPVDRALPGEDRQTERKARRGLAGGPGGRLRFVAPPHVQPQHEQAEERFGNVLVGVAVLRPEDVARADGEEEGRPDRAPRTEEAQ